MVGSKTRRVKNRRGGGPAEDQALLDATKHANLAGVKAALDAGANIEAMYENGTTSLFEAGMWDYDPNIVTELLKRGANTEAANKRGQTLLWMLAFIGSHFHTIDKLLARGAKVDAADNNGTTPLMEASYVGNSDMVKKLIQKGADVNKRNLNNQTAYDLARKQQVRDLFERLAQRQAVAVTGAHPESTMPNPDVASMVGKFLGGKRKTRKLKLKSIKPSHKKEKKWDATFIYADGHQKVVPFGAKGMSDYTKHRDPTRKQRYLKRHSGMGESWQKPDTPGALAKWVLWNKKTLRASIADYKRRFKL